MESTVEQNVQLRYFDFALQTITAIPIFNGERGSVENFIRQMDAACAVAQEVQVAESVKTCLGFQFMNRISPEAQREARININMTWTEVRTRLKNRYGGLQRPLTGHVWKILTMEKARAERAGEYAGRMCEEVRLLKRRIDEAGYGETEATWRTALYEELAVEALRRNLPEQMRRAIRAPEVTTIEKAYQLIEDKEIAAREYRPVTETGWTEVRQRPIRTMPRRPQQVRTREAPALRRREPQRWVPRVPEKEKHRLPRQRRECWECGEEGHFARECPYIFRRDRDRRRDIGISRSHEPMEINAQDRRRRHRFSGYSDEESSASEGEQSIASSQSSQERPNRGRIGKEPGRVKATDKPEVRSYAEVTQQ